MKWLSDLWATSSLAVQIALIVGVAAIAGMLLWAVGSLDALGDWLLAS